MSAQKVLEANKEDGKEILKVLESSSAKGSIELLYTRRPDAYLSYSKESNDFKVYNIKENDEKIVGTIAQINREVYIGGKVTKASYICGLKKDEDYKGIVNWGKVFVQNLVIDDVDCYYCSILSDNIDAQKMFEKVRKNTTNFNILTKYTTFLQKSRFHIKCETINAEFKVAKSEDENKIIDFLNKYGKEKDLFPVIKKISDLSDLRTEDFYYLEKDNQIIALGALWNQTSYRQYIVKKYNGIIKIAKLFNPIISSMGYMKLPKENEVFNFPMLSFLIAQDDNELYYENFLNSISSIVHTKYDFFAYGTSQNSVPYKIFKKLKNISFDSKIYTIDFLIKNKKSAKTDGNNAWIECGML